MREHARKGLARCTAGQALLETALVLPLLLVLIFFVALNLSAAARGRMECFKPMVAVTPSLLRSC
jgi:hypothetical protein